MEEKADCSEVCVGGVGGGWLDHCAEKEGDALGSKYLGKAWGGGQCRIFEWFIFQMSLRE